MPSSEPTPGTAKMMIQQLEGSGQPPETGVRFFTVGLDEYTSSLEEEYLGENGTLRQRSSTFKLVEAAHRDVWIYVDGRELKDLYRDRNGDVLFVVPGAISDEVLVEVTSSLRESTGP